MMKMKNSVKVGLMFIILGMMTSCDSWMNMDSNLVMYAEDHQLDEPADTVYSVIGILGKLQRIADKTVLLGELRGDLTDLTPYASNEIKQLASFTAGTDNKYNAPEDFYAVINSCNFYLAHSDTILKVHNEPVFLKEIAAVKAFRAWTYLQLAKIYGKVPFVTLPILSEADAEKFHPVFGMDSICSYFVEDLKPFIHTEVPNYGAINSLDSRKFFIPIRVLLGELCLWSGRYLEAAHYYHDYITLENKEKPIGNAQVSWSTESSDFEVIVDNYRNQFPNVANEEIICYIPMEQTAASGTFSDLKNVFNSTIDNNYYYQAGPSKRLIELSSSQSNCIIYDYGVKRDTLFAPETNEVNPFLVGDLRLYSYYRKSSSATSTGSLYASERQTIAKIHPQHVVLYRRAQIYLRYAEAMNRAGFPESAFTLLKYGLNASNAIKYISADERSRAGSLLTFSLAAFDDMNTMGIHARGCGDVRVNSRYSIPTCSNLADSIDQVEKLISDENALETSFEGNRFYDLMRMSKNRGDIDFLAKKIAGKKGRLSFDANIYGILSNQENWFLPLK